MSDRIEGKLLLTLHLESLKALDNPELMGRGEYRLRLWLNGLERWQSADLIRVRQGGETTIGEAVSMELAYDTDVVNLMVQAAEQDLLSGDDLSEGSFELYRAVGFFNGQSLDIPIEGPGTDLMLRYRVEATALA